MAVKVRSLKSQNQSPTPKAQSPRSQGSRAKGTKARKIVAHPVNNNGQVLFDTNRRIHFVGIGGIGMSGIAELLLNLGYRVSGSDLAESETTRRLMANGAQVWSGGHRAEHVTPETDVVVISSAVKFSNPEVVRARELIIPVIPRAEMLAELMRLKYGIAVAGTHGKTTTTSLIAAVLAQAHLDPTMVIGGKLDVLGGANARLGQSRFLVAEADESDGTFVLLSPTVVVVTNIDPEHLDFYGDLEKAKAAYLSFINRIPFYGRAVLCLDSVNVRALLPHVHKRFVTYGLGPDAELTARDLRVTGLTTSCEVWHGQECLGPLRLNLPGRHYALNALAVVAVARELGIPFTRVQEALAAFAGIQRRFEVKGEEAGVMVVDDYAHHPEELRVTLRAAREGVARGDDRRLIALFQPHRYSRTRDLFDDFLSAFDDADVLFLTEIYAAGEESIDGVTGESLYRALKKRGHADVRFVPQKEELVPALLAVVQPGDVVLTLGAGDIYRTGVGLLSRLQEGGLRAP
jgi:UDP-N-acetylmuramate--alanine ligase